MAQHHVAAGTHHLLLTVVLGIVAGEREGITLLEPHMSERLYGVLLLIEIGTVAPQLCAIVAEMHLALDNLCARVVAELVEHEFI